MSVRFSLISNRVGDFESISLVNALVKNPRGDVSMRSAKIFQAWIAI